MFSFPPLRGRESDARPQNAVRLRIAAIKVPSSR